MSGESAPTTPRLSILLLCWNHAGFLQTCIEGLDSQTCRNFDVVFLDNASTDGSAALAERLLASTTLQYRILRNERPRGISANLNRLLTESAGELVAPLSTDDWYAPTYVEAMCATADRHPDSALLATNGWSVFDGDRAEVPSRAPPLENELVGNRFLFEQDFFFWVGLCYRRAALVALGGWDEKQVVEDIDLLYRLTRHHPVTQLADRLVYYRRSKGSISLDPLFMAEGRLRFFNKHRADFGSKWSTIVAEMLRSSAAVAIDQRKFGGATRLLVRSLALRPIEANSWRTVLYLIRAAARRSQ